MNTAVDSIKQMLVFRERDLSRAQEEMQTYISRASEVLLIIKRLHEEIEDLKDAIDTLEKNDD